MELDSFDVKILALLQRDNQVTHEAIGDAVGLSPSVVSRRLKRLRDTGVIEADIAVVSLKMAGPIVSYLVHCRLERAEADTWERFSAFLRSSPEVINAYSVTGDTDFSFSVTTRTVEAYQLFLGRMLDAFPTLRNVTTNVVLEQIKRTLTPPIDLVANGA
jgi:Lrp/AsnC family leucine-responsive transcriptional regulator